MCFGKAALSTTTHFRHLIWHFLKQGALFDLRWRYYIFFKRSGQCTYGNGCQADLFKWEAMGELMPPSVMDGLSVTSVLAPSCIKAPFPHVSTRLEIMVR